MDVGQRPPQEASAPVLTPRQQQTLQYLLAGRSEKEIATKLGLSRNTIHHYVKELYKRYQVSSRAELLAKWIQYSPTDSKPRVPARGGKPRPRSAKLPTGTPDRGQQ